MLIIYGKRLWLINGNSKTLRNIPTALVPYRMEEENDITLMCGTSNQCNIRTVQSHK